ncbi:hypothetical protein LNP74_03830 [Klebsiella pneumoniae subsp. pneumoniae]|nr:hypothetical protein [Klebsiella pneumoniae subsp. pneumoniae]
MEPKEIVEDAAYRAFLERGTAHVAWGTEGVFAPSRTYLNSALVSGGRMVSMYSSVFCLIFVRDIFRSAQRIFEEANLHAQIVQANVQSGVGVSERIQRHVPRSFC